MKDDPKVVRPNVELLTAQRSASDAADFARDAADELPQHGFHKASGAWWGSDGQDFHRFVITARRPPGVVPVLLSLAVGAAATVMVSRKMRAPR